MTFTCWGMRPTWAMTGIPRSVRKRMVLAISVPPSSLMALQPVSLMTFEVLRKACSGEPS